MAKSLVSKSTELVLPSVDVPSTEVVSSIATGAYAAFVSNRSRAFPDLVAKLPGLKEPDVVLVRGGGKDPIKLDPFKTYFVGGKQYWASINDQGELLDVKFSKTPKYTECIETVLLAIHGGTLHPCVMTFRSTKCPAAQTMAAALAEASDNAKWEKKGEAHKESVVHVSKPFLRFVATISCKQKTGRSTGFSYWQASASVSPSTPNDWLLVGKWIAEEGLAEFTSVCEKYKSRISELEGKVG